MNRQLSILKDKQFDFSYKYLFYSTKDTFFRVPGFQCNTIICLFILCLLLSSFLGLPLRQFPSLLHNRMEIIISIDEKFSWSYLFCNSPNAIHGCVLHTYILKLLQPMYPFSFYQVIITIYTN